MPQIRHTVTTDHLNPQYAAYDEPFLRPPDWTKRALCWEPSKQQVFFAAEAELEKMGNSNRTDPASPIVQAELTCAVCPVRARCLSDTLKAEGKLPSEFRASIAGGKTPADRWRIAHNLPPSKRTLAKMKERAKDPKRACPEWVDEAIAWRKQGYTVPEVAAKVGKGRSTVQTWLTRMNFKIGHVNRRLSDGCGTLVVPPTERIER